MLYAKTKYKETPAKQSVIYKWRNTEIRTAVSFTFCPHPPSYSACKTGCRTNTLGSLLL